MLRNIAPSYAVALLATLNASCLGVIEGNECVGANRQAIYNGESDPEWAGISVQQARAIGGIENEYGVLLCTGALIHPRWILTASHCAGDGLRFRMTVPETDATLVILDEAIRHPTLDLALLHVREPLPSSAPRPLAIRTQPLEQLLTVGAPALLCGVGLDEEGGRGRLQFVQEPVLAIKAQSIMVDGRGQTGACTGDSGGPLIGGHTQSQPEVIGVLSKGESSCMGRDLYIRVDAELAWITQTLPKHELIEAGPAHEVTQDSCGAFAE